ncbi:MAG: phosphohydrolase [Cyclobacteriaceae bacterium]|nr:phosphohydrolase [Cyclobacteriaceae bacterium]
MKAKELMSHAASHVRDVFAKHHKSELLYHCLSHTEKVVAAAEKIADHYELSKQDYTAVYIAVWFHDLGYLFTTGDKHEEKGVELATEFIMEESGDEELVEKVKECIMATKMPQSPVSLISQIVCDADLFHLGTEEFTENSKQIKGEKERISGIKISGKEWRKQTLFLLEGIRFHTEYARQLLQKTKDENIARLKERIKEDDMKNKSGDNSKAKDKESKPFRGVETMFRTTSSNHLRLSEMADAKANIMITVNSIIASILVSILFRKLEEDERFLFPAMIFLITALVSIVFAILVTRPNVTQGTFTKEDIEKKRANLLFFGNFHNMSLKDYQQGVDAMMADSEFLYGSMTRDIYFLGIVLARKYKLLRFAYSFFMFGFVLSVLSFVIAVTMFQK